MPAVLCEALKGSFRGQALWTGHVPCQLPCWRTLPGAQQALPCLRYALPLACIEHIITAAHISTSASATHPAQPVCKSVYACCAGGKQICRSDCISLLLHRQVLARHLASWLSGWGAMTAHRLMSCRQLASCPCFRCVDCSCLIQ